MKAAELISIFDEDRTNEISEDLKLRWLKEVEHTVVDEIVKTHELPEELAEIDFDTYFDDWGPDKDLLVPESYDILYIHYLEMKMGWKLAEPKLRNSGGDLYNTALMTYKQYYTRHNRPNFVPPVFTDHMKL